MLLQRLTAHGPFDIIGDVHGCLDELLALMAALGYGVEQQDGEFEVTPPEGRSLVFVGDLVNRGPSSAGVLRLAMSLARSGQALYSKGNQDLRLARALMDGAAQQSPGLTRSLEQFAGKQDAFRSEAAWFLDAMPSYCILDDRKLVIAHAGLPERMQGSSSAKALGFALGGESTGETDAVGMPVRYNWAADYRGQALVVYGHTPVAEPLRLNNTINIDTGCVYGGKLTALRYPEGETVSVPAKTIYWESRRGFKPNPALKQPQENG